MLRIDPATNTVTATAAVPAPVTNLAVGGGFAWATNETKGTVYKIDQRGRIVATTRPGDGAHDVSFADGRLWVVNQDAGSVTGIDAASGSERVFQFGHPLNSVTALGREVLVVIEPGKTVADQIEQLKGDVGRFIVPIYQFDPADTALAANPFVRQVERATCASLLRYPDAAPPEGFRLRPELATAMPTVSADRKTYTFTVRDGYRFAPPLNAPVTANTIRYGIERALYQARRQRAGHGISPRPTRRSLLPGRITCPHLGYPGRWRQHLLHAHSTLRRTFSSGSPYPSSVPFL